MGQSQIGPPLCDPEWFQTLSLSWFQVDGAASLIPFPALIFISLTQPRRVRKD